VAKTPSKNVSLCSNKLKKKEWNPCTVAKTPSKKVSLCPNKLKKGIKSLHSG